LTRLRVEATQDRLCATEDRDGELCAAAARVGVSADHRYTVLPRGFAQPREHLFGVFAARTPKRIDDRERTTAHRVDVADVDQHAAVAREPRVLRDELGEEALDREQQLAIVEVWQAAA